MSKNKKRYHHHKGNNEEENNQKEKMVVRTSRRTYILIYVLIIVFLLFLVVTKIKKIPTSPAIFWSIIIICIMLLKVTELHRLREKHIISQNSVSRVLGIFNVKTKSIDIFAISEVTMHQTLLQRILNIGDIKVMPFTNEKNTDPIKNAYNPKKVAAFIERNMTKARKST